MNAKSALWLALLMLVPGMASAKRTITLYPIDTPGGWAENGGPNSGPCWAGGQRKIDFKNLSETPQNVTVKISHVRLSFGTCDGVAPTPPLGGNWNQSDSAPSCWGTPWIDAPDFEQSLYIGPHGTGTVIATYLCKTERSGVTNCHHNHSFNTGSYAQSLTGLAVQMVETTVDIEVAEDRGALLANVVGSPATLCTDLRTVTRFNVPLNGGRPF